MRSALSPTPPSVTSRPRVPTPLRVPLRARAFPLRARAGAGSASSSSSATAADHDANHAFAMPSTGGYFRWPSLHGDTLLFVCEDDLYAVSLSGGVPRRITDAPGPVRRPIISPDGTTVAFTVVEEECQEIYACSVRGGPLSQITFQGAEFARAAAWAPDGSALFFVSSAGQPFPDVDELWYAALDFDGDGVAKANDANQLRPRTTPRSNRADADDSSEGTRRTRGGALEGHAGMRGRGVDDADGDGRFRL